MGALDKYWKFDTEKFVKDYPEYKQELIDAKEALKEHAEVKNKNYGSPPGTPGRGDCVAASAGKAEMIRKKIGRLNYIINLYENAYNQLSDEEKTIIRYSVQEPGLKSSNMRFLSNQLHYEPDYIYKLKRQALEHFKRLLGIK